MAKQGIEGLVRIGYVTDVDERGRRARVKYPGEGFTSGWLYLLGGEIAQETDSASGGSGEATFASHKHKITLRPWTPKVNDTVLCMYVTTDQGIGDGFILGRIQS